MLFVGARTREREHVEGDWMLAHETLHLAFPPVSSDARWLDEGLATYYEPLLRLQAGLLDERALWEYLVRQLPRGLEAMTRTGLRQARGIDAVYWGGGLYLLALDLEVRRRSNGRVRLSDALRGLLESGIDSGSRVHTLDELLDSFDATLGEPAAEFRRRFVDRAGSFDLDAFLAELGVTWHDGELVLDDSASGAQWRRSLREP